MAVSVLPIFLSDQQFKLQRFSIYSDMKQKIFTFEKLEAEDWKMTETIRLTNIFRLFFSGDWLIIWALVLFLLWVLTGILSFSVFPFISDIHMLDKGWFNWRNWTNHFEYLPSLLWKYMMTWQFDIISELTPIYSSVGKHSTILRRYRKKILCGSQAF